MFLNLFDLEIIIFVFFVYKISTNILNLIYYLFTFSLRKKDYQFLVENYLLKIKRNLLSLFFKKIKYFYIKKNYKISYNILIFKIYLLIFFHL